MIRALVAAMLSLSGGAASIGEIPGTVPDVRGLFYDSFVELWTSGEVLRRGERVNLWFRTAQDAFVTVLRIDTDGRVRILFPQRPWHNNYVAAGQQFEVRDPACDEERCAFVVDDYPGQGYVFAIASARPFDYGDFVRGDYWDYRNIAFNGRVTGDPFVAISSLMERIVRASGAGGYSYDVSPYYVENRFEYPRFLCYDCHAYVRFPAWDPYEQSCVQYRLVIHDEPEYGPARFYDEMRVVFTRPAAIQPQHVFMDRTPDEPFVTRVRRPDPSGSPTRRAFTGVTARDVGGVGRVPAPLGRRVLDSNDRGGRGITTGRSYSSGRRVVVPRDTATTRPQPRLQRRIPTQPLDTARNSRGSPPRVTLPGTRTRTTRPVVPQATNPSRGDSTARRTTPPTVKPTIPPRRRKTKADTIPTWDQRLSNRPRDP